jgi:hypothetical protein
MGRAARIHLRVLSTGFVVVHIIHRPLADIEAPPEYLFAFGGRDEVSVIMRRCFETRGLRGFCRITVVVGTWRRTVALAAGDALMFKPASSGRRGRDGALAKNGFAREMALFLNANWLCFNRNAEMHGVAIRSSESSAWVAPSSFCKSWRLRACVIGAPSQSAFFGGAIDSAFE